MTLDKTITTRTKHRAPPDNAGGANQPQESSLLNKAKVYSQVARDSFEDCERGENAVTQMKKRRNHSGQ